MDLRAQLQSAIGSSYTIERELGGGGMSRVFVAEETALGRKVVVKVLPPDLSAGVNVERFKREIQLAARLQQAHILPVLSAGEMEGVPYYTMPYVEGQSLRSRLATHGALPIAETVGILRDVAKALAYAHEHGVVHRDIKPDNVLLAGGSAVVADFGIAKAISAARTDGSGHHAMTLTQVGTSLGTPAYMAPEQAASDPSTDHRADIYSFGVMAYEMIAGRPPFVASTPQKLLAMQMAETPEPISNVRPGVSQHLAELVMACLEKDANHRPQNAGDVVRILEMVTSPGTSPAMPAVLLGGSGMLKKALLAWAGAFVVVALVAKLAIAGIGLPSWVFAGAITVMALGLPVILFTAYVYNTARRVATMTPTYTPGGTPSMARGTMATLAVKASPHVSWRRTTWGGVIAAGAFVLIIAGYMTLRALGIGPAGSLLAAGALAQNDRMLVADFEGPASDTTLGPVVTEAFRTSFGQSKSIALLQPGEVREVLRRMQRDPKTRVDLALAREIGAREGLRAVIDGGVISLGGKYQLSVRLVNTQTGDPLASFTRMASAQADILPAIDELTKDLRAKIGESLRSVQASKPLEQVTTFSLEALRKYVQAVHALEVDGDMEKGSADLDEAISLDSGFAMAYRKYAMELSNRGGHAEKVMDLLQKAYDHRDRLSDAERYLTTAAYYHQGPHNDRAKAIEAYEALLDIQPDNGTALNNVSLLYNYEREWTKSEAVLKRAVALASPAAQEFNNLAVVQFTLGRIADARQTLGAAAKLFPNNPAVDRFKANIMSASGYEDSARAILLDLTRRSANPSVRDNAALGLAALAEAHGRLAEGAKWRSDAAGAAIARRVAAAPLNVALDSAFRDVWYRDDAARAVREADAAIAAHPIDSIAGPERPYARVVAVYALAGRADRAKAYLAQFERSRATFTAPNDDIDRHAMLGEIAVSERRYDEAIRQYRAADQGPCAICALADLAHAYDLAGQRDSAIAVFTRYVTTPTWQRLTGVAAIDARFLAGTYKRLGELYEAKNDKAHAAEFYGKFVDLWKTADPDLQPKVREVQARLAKLRVSGG